MRTDITSVLDERRHGVCPIWAVTNLKLTYKPEKQTLSAGSRNLKAGHLRPTAQIQ